ncbi:dethiobiotin synthase [Desulfobulbus alkaliphilus]|uniref:dethiobiotin synthase n=1 Tax=Desulfobulbus alkaliphilus TaxID=869814 RepID=UPI001964FE86|nr:dethiobiotin synthase [Desulfobulbus alkaliphilus]MBM9536699.1 ATP-dependent dethiobiotin synthetase BioD [Desulfobulbus alkaliphilus]
MSRSQGAMAIGGIDTGVGKSYVTGLLGRYLLQQGWATTTLKLVQTGCRDTSDDIMLHRKIMGQELTDFDRQGITCPYVFPFPASPKLAAEMTGQTIEASVLDQSLVTLQKDYQWLLVEGAGGLLVPLNRDLLLLDYIAANNLPLILVTTPRLGSINHTRLSLEAIRSRSITLCGLVYNLFGDHPKEIVQDTLKECRQALTSYGFKETIVLMPDIRESSAAAWQSLLPSASNPGTSGSEFMKGGC